MSGAGQPRHARAEIRAFAKWLRTNGWVYESVDSSGHTIWSHPKASGQYKLPETPTHFSVQAARRDVARLLGQRVPGKRKGKGKPKPERRDFALQQAQRQAAVRERERASSEESRASERPVPSGPAASVRRPARRLPWEDGDEDYDRGIERLMREIPGGRK
ncbi:hypothetical protein [Nocardioides panaciterrulae]|uniref:Uncharacterized protein n=1 Tax=Nocardioides panaciterrulae TaxID=661492 RepID=A0A7Y9E2Y5_9ACTN|nr:hypothetical protein [Nocardioides panaciterrulae]NYD39947.1 hypothetical protein [Nocardioides panaciterrulae]NYD43979.1 hypothetical protein [Nocardioides panaciterrulae]